MITALVTLAIASAPAAERVEAFSAHHCYAKPCVQRERRRVRHVSRWRRVARPYRGWLRATSLCESGSAGWYGLQTTGNGFWFAFQFTPQTWRSVGGRFRRGVPAGRWGEFVPIRAEQKFRAVKVLRSQGAGAWPRCG